MSIHDENPFAPPPAERDPVRRLRGRLAAPVTVLTAGDGHQRAGLTVSSLLVVEGQPGRVAALVGEVTDFWEVVSGTGAFLVHVLAGGDWELADRFAGLRPTPGGTFVGLEVEDTPFGPRLAAVADWAGCRLESAEELGFHRLLVGTIEETRLSDLSDPLVYFRGRYRHLG